ncbi:MAG TPA: SAM-dependent chlorinase/fluorinase [Acidimicrobiales bacterium]|nr:SAM-dependent chlorinase/fluorinase [Acidimicrobiales bacterium]
MSSPDAVYFFSDYGLRDEFVGVVHAAIRRHAPHATVVDLTHGLQPFDVRGGGWMLARVLPRLGPGVVLGVVDPGVGGGRRGVAVRVPDEVGHRWLVGPDNGLLMAAADAAGPVELAVELVHPARWPGRREVGPGALDRDALEGTGGPVTGGPGAVRQWSGPVSFDGRDLFAPAAAALCSGASADDLGTRIDPAALVRLPPPVDERGVLPDGRRCIRAEVTAVDHFGNVKTSVAVDHGLAASLPLESHVELVPGRTAASGPVDLRTVRTFADLAGGELGLMADADGHLSLVARERSAAMVLDLGVGDLLDLSW